MAATKGQLSRRQYAAHRGVSRQMVDKYVAADVIPVMRSGLINPVEADAALAKRSIAARPGVSLAEARRRKLSASVALLVDEVDQLEASAVPPAEIAEFWKKTDQMTRERFAQMATQIVPQVAGRPAAEAFKVLTEAVREVLTDLAQTEVVAVDAAGNECKPEAAETGAALAKSTATQLAARKADLHARKLEHRRALRRGDLVELTRTGRLVVRRLSEIRARALALPTKTAPLFAAADEDRALAILRKEIAAVLESLQRPLLEDLHQ